MTHAPADRAPELLTARLRLRAHRPGDVDTRVTMMADAAVSRFLGGVPQGREECWARVQRYAGMWALDGVGLFAVEDRDTGGFLGEVGLARFGRDLGDDFDQAHEAAWIMASAHWGRGFAREAMEATLAWHARAFGAARLVCVISAENTASLALAARLGFRPFREASYRGNDCILLERLPKSDEAQ